jgi:hypothetical protein
MPKYLLRKENSMYRKFIASSLLLFVAACAGLPKPTPTVNVPDKLRPPANESLAPMNGHSLHPRPISLIQAEGGLADTMPVRIGNRPTAARSRVQ